MSCINQILEFYYNEGQYKDSNSNSVKIWFSNMVIKLTSEKITTEKESLQVRNCLILLINLFSGINEIDHYNLKGKAFFELTKIEKNMMNEAIRAAIMNDL